MFYHCLNCSKFIIAALDIIVSCFLNKRLVLLGILQLFCHVGWFKSPVYSGPLKFVLFFPSFVVEFVQLLCLVAILATKTSFSFHCY